jgi:hypothetical protein
MAKLKLALFNIFGLPKRSEFLGYTQRIKATPKRTDKRVKSAHNINHTIQIKDYN